MTAVSLLVVALAVAAVLSIVAGSRADDRDKRPVTDIADLDTTGGGPSTGPSDDLGR